MLPRKNRIVKKAEFEKIKKVGRRIPSASFSAVFLKGEGKDPKFGFVVSGKVAKKAVDRNRTKRVFSQSVRDLMGNFPEGVEVVFLLNKKALLLREPEVKKEIERFSKKI